VPPQLNGTFRLIPEIEMAGFEHRIVTREVHFRNGVLVDT